MNRDGHALVQRIGARRQPLRDLYLWLLSMRWRWLIVLLVLGYLSVVSFFAFLYSLGGDCILNARPHSFADMFFFSVQTLSTIGYGVMAPQSTYANIVVCVQAFCGVLSVALVTGLAFAKFSRPSVRVIFSRHAVITERDGIPMLMVRMANERKNYIVEARLRLTLILDDINSEGERIRRFYDLPLERKWTPVFALTWTAFHPILESSPFRHATAESLIKRGAEIVASFTGIDETYNQAVYARTSYIPEEIVFGASFVDMFESHPRGKVLNYDRLHEYRHHDDIETKKV